MIEERLLDDALGDLLGVLFFFRKLFTADALLCWVLAFPLRIALDVSILFFEITVLAAFFCCLRVFFSNAIVIFKLDMINSL